MEPHVVMLYSAATHLRPVNLVRTQPFFGAQGFQEEVCNKARAYLDCQTEHPCPSVPRLICLLHDWYRYHPVVLLSLSVSCHPWMVRSILGCCCWLAGMGRRRARQYARATIINAHSLPEIVWSCLLFLLITVDPDIHITDLIHNAVACVCPFL